MVEKIFVHLYFLMQLLPASRHIFQKFLSRKKVFFKIENLAATPTVWIIDDTTRTGLFLCKVKAVAV